MCRRYLSATLRAERQSFKIFEHPLRSPMIQRVDRPWPQAYMPDLALLPGRLTVRLRTLTPSIEVRILTGEP